MRNFSMLILALVALGIKLVSLDHNLVEKYYSNGLYPFISAVQRVFFGWIPFSIGDLLYGYVIVWLAFQAASLIRKIRRKQANASYFKGVLTRTLRICLFVYISFNLLWGLNYNRTRLDIKLGIESLEYGREDLIRVTALIARRMNGLRQEAAEQRDSFNRKSALFERAASSYERLAGVDPSMAYRFPSVKPSLYSYLGNYLGFTGYYNPFTGEAQVNTTVPVFIRPFTTCHEIGHQLGYAKESEANFAGYLAAAGSGDAAFRYSVYFDLYAYSARYLYMADSVALSEIRGTLSPGVKTDIEQLRSYVRKYSTPIGTAIDKLYAQYLVANEQPSGRMSYNEVVAMLIGYFRKHGKI